MEFNSSTPRSQCTRPRMTTVVLKNTYSYKSLVSPTTLISSLPSTFISFLADSSEQPFDVTYSSKSAIRRTRTSSYSIYPNQYGLGGRNLRRKNYRPYRKVKDRRFSSDMMRASPDQQKCRVCRHSKSVCCFTLQIQCTNSNGFHLWLARHSDTRADRCLPVPLPLRRRSDKQKRWCFEFQYSDVR